MKITIDTKEDSHDEIRKVLHLLTNLVSKEESLGFEEKKEQVDPTPMMGMFNDSSPVQEEVQETQEEKAPNFGSFLGLTEQKEEDNEDNSEEKPKVEFF